MSAKDKKQKLSSYKKAKLDLKVEELEERIAPSMAPGLLGYEGQPGNQGGGNHHP